MGSTLVEQKVLKQAEAGSTEFYPGKRFPGRPALRPQLYPDPAMYPPAAPEVLLAAAPSMLAIALEEARLGLAEGGLPIGAAIFRADGTLLSRGHNRRVQLGDPSIHGETDAFRNAGRQRSYRDLIMVTTLAPCWYCSGLIRQFGFGTVILGESVNFSGGEQSLRELGVQVIDLADPACIAMMRDYIAANPAVWNEDIGVE